MQSDNEFELEDVIWVEVGGLGSCLASSACGSARTVNMVLMGGEEISTMM
jgi:hypothetical protein